MKTLLALCFALLLTGCGSTIKTAEYTFNQGTPDCPEKERPLGVAESRGGAGSTNTGGSGNTIIIIEDSRQDSEATTDGAFGTNGAMAATGAIKDAVSKLVTDMRKTNSENPQTTNTTTTNTVEEEIAEPEGLEDKPVVPEGTIIEED